MVFPVRRSSDSFFMVPLVPMVKIRTQACVWVTAGGAIPFPQLRVDIDSFFLVMFHPLESFFHSFFFFFFSPPPPPPPNPSFGPVLNMLVNFPKVFPVKTAACGPNEADADRPSFAGSGHADIYFFPPVPPLFAVILCLDIHSFSLAIPATFFTPGVDCFFALVEHQR